MLLLVTGLSRSEASIIINSRASSNDASASMAYRGPDAPGAKLAYAALLGAALPRVAVATAARPGL